MLDFLLRFDFPNVTLAKLRVDVNLVIVAYVRRSYNLRTLTLVPFQHFELPLPGLDPDWSSSPSKMVFCYLELDSLQ